MSITDSKKAGNSVVINSVDRALDVLEYLFKANQEVSLSQISKDLHIYKSTVFRTLATLESRGYVTQNKASELYAVGPKLYAYGARPHGNIIIQSVQPFLEAIREKYGETASFSVLERDASGMYLIRLVTSIASSHILSAGVDLSLQDECYCAATGKCLLAFGESIDLSVYKRSKLVPFTDKTITTYEGLLEEMKKIRQQGYALDDEERETGLFCLGVPVLNNGYAIAAISISGAVSRIKNADLDEKIAFMKEISDKISAAAYIQ